MTEFGRYLKQCPAALKDKTRTLSLLKDALKNDLPKFRVLQAAYELGILELSNAATRFQQMTG